jgi:hypothetical protein
MLGSTNRSAAGRSGTGGCTAENGNGMAQAFNLEDSQNIGESRGDCSIREADAMRDAGHRASKGLRKRITFP